jgi:hypothetical protein
MGGPILLLNSRGLPLATELFTASELSVSSFLAEKEKTQNKTTKISSLQPTFSLSLFFSFKRNMFFMVAVFFRSSPTVRHTREKKEEKIPKNKMMTGAANGSNLVRHRCAFSSYLFILFLLNLLLLLLLEEGVASRRRRCCTS